jgi:hypothetical protein
VVDLGDESWDLLLDEVDELVVVAQVLLGLVLLLQVLAHAELRSQLLIDVAHWLAELEEGLGVLGKVEESVFEVGSELGSLSQVSREDSAWHEVSGDLALEVALKVVGAGSFGLA